MDFHTALVATAARTTQVRDSITSARQLETFLHTAGFTKRQARAITAGGWRAYEGADPQDDPAPSTRDAGQDPQDDADLVQWLREAAAKHAHTQ